MAASKRKSAGLTRFESIAGGIFLAFYLLLLPVTRTLLFRLLEALLGSGLSAAAKYSVLYCLLLLVTVLIFYYFIGGSLRRFFGSFSRSVAHVGVGLVAFYGLNELLCRLIGLFMTAPANINDDFITTQMSDAASIPPLVLVLIAPFVEEMLFRGYIFASLRARSPLLAYAVSCLLFASVHVWRFVGGDMLSLQRFVLLVQYLVPGLVLCWSYDRSDNVFAPFLVHAAVNALMYS